MDIEFHYYINFLIAILGGFDFKTSAKIAYSAQYVDDNNTNYHIHLDKNNNYTYELTQCMDLTNPDLEKILILYHFLPSCKKGKAFWVTQSNSKLANYIMKKAMEDGSPYYIGIASHAFADTYAHQNFIGKSDAYNNILNIKNIVSIGHMHYGTLPDQINVNWYDSRKGIKIYNNVRFLKAAIKLLQFYGQYNSLSKNILDEKVRTLKLILSIIWGDSSNTLSANLDYPNRVKKYQAAIQQLTSTIPPNYTKMEWLYKSIFYCKNDKIWKIKQNFEQLDWFKFQETASRYKVEILKYKIKNK